MSADQIIAVKMEAPYWNWHNSICDGVDAVSFERYEIAAIHIHNIVTKEKLWIKLNRYVGSRFIEQFGWKSELNMLLSNYD